MAGCGAASRTGTLVGTLGVYGGAQTARSCGCFMEEGTVRLSDAHRALFVTVPKSGRFSAQVPAGRYTVEAGTRGGTDWPMGSCRMLLIADKPGGTPTSQKSQKYLTVRQSQTTHVVVGCVGV